MDKFEASNGGTVVPFENGRIAVTDLTEHRLSEDAKTTQRTAYLEPEMVATLREFFQHLRDEELGRWRWPENPDYVVYPRDEYGQTVVLRESTGHNITFLRGQVNKQGSDYAQCALAFFEAHPEPKPAWYEAKQNEIWVLTLEGDMLAPEAYRFDGGAFRPVNNPSRFFVRPDASLITTARRIYPEEAS